MPNNFINLEDLEDFFEEGFDVISATTTSWSFAATSDEFAGYSATLQGTGFNDTGESPEIGTVTGITIVGPDGVVTEVTGLSLPVSDLFDEIDLDDEEDEDEDEDADEEEEEDDEVEDDDDDSDDGDELFAGDDEDELDGSDGDDDIHAGGGDDDLFGDAGDDDLYGGLGADLLKGSKGKDDLVGDEGDDDLDGGNGKDELHGEEDDDDLSGGNGKDDLDGGTGDDSLDGGRGKDCFLFGEDFGTDTIEDFREGKDCIDLSATGLSLSFEDLAIVYDATGATITTAEGTIHVGGASGLEANDFVF